MKDKTIKNAMNDIEKIILDVYSQGYNDGIRFSNKVHAYTGDYECGLNDAWECARIMTNLSFEDFNKIFNKNYVVDAIRDYSASEAMAKIKEYEEKQKKNCDTCQYLHGGFNSLKKCANCYGNSGWTPKQTEDAEIKVGDEVIYHGRGAQIGAHDGSIGVVIGIEKEWVGVRFKSSWNCVGICKDKLTKTGRHFDSIEKVIEELGNEKN